MHSGGSISQPANQPGELRKLLAFGFNSETPDKLIEVCVFEEHTIHTSLYYPQATPAHRFVRQPQFRE
jgi:hypothetical protein